MHRALITHSGINLHAGWIIKGVERISTPDVDTVELNLKLDCIQSVYSQRNVLLLEKLLNIVSPSTVG